MLCTENRMTQPQRITLAYGGHCDMIGYDVFDRAQNGLFALLLKPVLKLVVRIKVVFDRLFAATCDEDNFSDARRDRFLTTCSIMGRSYTGNNSFGIALVAGSMRVPRPATGITAFLMFAIMIYPSVTAQSSLSTID